MTKTSAALLVVVLSVAVAFAATAGDMKKAVTASLGALAPSFTLKNQTESEINLEDYRGKTVVLEWVNPDCPFVKRHYEAGTMKTLAEKYADQDVVWIAVNSTKSFDISKNADFVKAEELSYDVLDDSKGKVGRKYEATNTPHMFVIDKEGKLAYRGAIDDDPRGGKDDVTNYVAAALDSLTKGEKVKVSETKAYGCSVKYASK